MTEHLEKLADGRLLVVGPVHKTRLRQESDGTQRPYTETGIPVARGEAAITVSESVLDAIVASAVMAERKRCGDIIIDALFPHDRSGVEKALNAQDLVQATASPVEARGGQLGSERKSPFDSDANRLGVAQMLIKSMHDENMDYSLINNLTGHNNHNLRWARRFLGLKEVMTEDEAREYLYLDHAESGDGTATAAQKPVVEPNFSCSYCGKLLPDGERGICQKCYNEACENAP